MNAANVGWPLMLPVQNVIPRLWMMFSRRMTVRKCKFPNAPTTTEKSNRQCAVGKICPVLRNFLGKNQTSFCFGSFSISACTQKLDEMRVDVKKSKVKNREIEDRNKFYERQRMLHHTTGNKEFFKLAVGLLFSDLSYFLRSILCLVATLSGIFKSESVILLFSGNQWTFLIEGITSQLCHRVG